MYVATNDDKSFANNKHGLLLIFSSLSAESAILSPDPHPPFPSRLAWHTPETSTTTLLFTTTLYVRTTPGSPLAFSSIAHFYVKMHSLQLQRLPQSSSTPSMLMGAEPSMRTSSFSSARWSTPEHRPSRAISRPRWSSSTRTMMASSISRSLENSIGAFRCYSSRPSASKTGYKSPRSVSDCINWDIDELVCFAQCIGRPRHT